MRNGICKGRSDGDAHRSGARSYSGTFFNQQYNTGGQIRITVSGRTQSVRLSGEAGSAFFSLRKL